MMRPRRKLDWELEHFVCAGDPYGYITEGSAMKLDEIAFCDPTESREVLVERSSRLTKGKAYRRYTAKYTNKKTLVRGGDGVLGSRYGYIWRGIIRRT